MPVRSFGIVADDCNGGDTSKDMRNEWCEAERKQIEPHVVLNSLGLIGKEDRGRNDIAVDSRQEHKNDAD